MEEMGGCTSAKAELQAVGKGGRRTMGRDGREEWQSGGQLGNGFGGLPKEAEFFHLRGEGPGGHPQLQ